MGGQRRALIVASDEYEHEGLRHLLSPAADAHALAEVLGDPQVGGFDVEVARNEPAHAIQAHVEELLLEGQPEDVLLLHFSCHGLKSESGELFFAARNTRPNRLGSTAVSADFVQRCMRASRSRSVVLLLDCCYGGAFSQGVTVRAAGEVNVLDSFASGKLGGGRGRAVITASSAMEYAFEGDRLADDHSQPPSVFTAALVEGLKTGDADRDEDGLVSLNELYDYVFDRVREQTPHQTPSRDIEMQGELYLAHSRRRRIRPRPIPADLEEARTDANMYTRLGAVRELRKLQASDDLPAALGAHEALQDTARTDVGYVADTAAAALRKAAIRTDERQLHFGQVDQDSSPPHRTIRLLGPPLARTCTFHTSANWLRIDQTADGLDVSVDTSRGGTRQGTITLTGPTGQAEVTVDAEITAGHEVTADIQVTDDTAVTYEGATVEHRVILSPPQTPPTKPLPQAAREMADTRAAPTASDAPPPNAPPAPDSTPLPVPTPVGTTTVAEPDTGRPATPRPRPASVAPVIARGEHHRRREALWALIPVLSFGFLTVLPFLHAAVRLRDRRLWLIAFAYAAGLTTLFIVAVQLASNGGSPVGFFLYVALFLVATVHAFRLRRRVFAGPSAPLPSTEA